MDCSMVGMTTAAIATLFGMTIITPHYAHYLHATRVLISGSTANCPMR
ncbi:MAG: hypothetical protein O3B43_03865 [Chloroflexi bacterium]|nr:hypothetical protein [Chloroflexota bacterium]